MSATTVRNPKGPADAPADGGARPFVSALVNSSVGAKVLVALTGLSLVTFLVFHLIGNLKVFGGPDAINAYAHFLKHDLGALIWIARAGLLGLFVLHLALAIRLKLKARAARPVAYAYPNTVQATAESRTMLLTGLVILLFVVFHLAHYTFAWVHTAELQNGTKVNYLELTDAKGRHDVYSMMVAGFTTPWLCVFYIVTQLLLFVHLRHGIQSAFQTLGLKNARFRAAIGALGLAVCGALLIGNLFIVCGIWAGLAPPLR
jgi:succinate dehydrogenase / fumarate reductase, cytochrome b subunit